MPRWPASLRRILLCTDDLGWGMSAMPDTIDHATLQDTEEVEHWLAEYQLNTSDGKPHRGRKPGQKESCWVVHASLEAVERLPWRLAEGFRRMAAKKNVAGIPADLCWFGISRPNCPWCLECNQRSSHAALLRLPCLSDTAKQAPAARGRPSTPSKCNRSSQLLMGWDNLYV
jgi:hypothetical protein